LTGVEGAGGWANDLDVQVSLALSSHTLRQDAGIALVKRIFSGVGIRGERVVPPEGN